MDAIQTGAFSQMDSVEGKTARATLDHVAMTIQVSGRQDPRLNGATTHLMLKRHQRGYAKVDPSTRHQKALYIAQTSVHQQVPE